MVQDPRASLGARSLRPLNTARSIWVQSDAEGNPLAVRRGRWPQPRPVIQIQDRWRIDDEWWRDAPISRLYHTVLVRSVSSDEGDLLLTIYHDLTAGAWFEQRDQGARPGM